MRALTTAALAAGLALPLAHAAGAQTADPAMPATITVTGEGSVEAAPDIATVSLGVTTQAPTAAEAMDANSAALRTVLDNLRGAGIEPRDIQTTGLSLNPNWNSRGYDGGPQQIDGYIASNVLNVRVRQIDRLGAVLDAAVADGANTLNGITFGVADDRPLLDDARAAAVEDARARATLLTRAAGVTLGRILSISEMQGFPPPVPMFRELASDAAAPVPVAGGEVAMGASVTVTWELQP